MPNQKTVKFMMQAEMSTRILNKHKNEVIAIAEELKIPYTVLDDSITLETTIENCREVSNRLAAIEYGATTSRPTPKGLTADGIDGLIVAKNAAIGQIRQLQGMISPDVKQLNKARRAAIGGELIVAAMTLHDDRPTSGVLPNLVSAMSILADLMALEPANERGMRSLMLPFLLHEFREEEPGFLFGKLDLYGASFHVEFIRVVDVRNAHGSMQQVAWQPDGATVEKPGNENAGRLCDLQDMADTGRFETCHVPGFEGDYVMRITPYEG